MTMLTARLGAGIAFAGALCLGVSAVAVSSAQAEIPEMRMQFAHAYPADNIWAQTTERFAEAIRERTDGKVTISIAGGGTTGSWQENIEALQIGTNDMVLESIGTLDRYDPLPGVEAYPYLVRDLDHFRAIYYGEVGADFADAVEEATGFKIIGAGYRGARKLSANRAVNSIEELAGLKLRVPPLRMYRQTWEFLGASPVPMSVNEIFTSLQQNVIDGQENPLELIYTMKFHEVQSHVIDTDHVIGAMTFIFDSATFESYPEELQEILIEEGREAMLWGTDQMIAQEQEYRELLEAEGVTFLSPDLEPFRAALEPMTGEFEELSEWVQRFAEVE